MGKELKLCLKLCLVGAALMAFGTGLTAAVAPSTSAVTGLELIGSAPGVRVYAVQWGLHAPCFVAVGDNHQAPDLECR